ncbi:hypothetical protein [Ferroacidibacillus organovorans]|uniref:Uncharacterized protein n=1 Tax=Ferroacidibacillus organovorans TaxID=1765683 RepID=A0A162TTK7_9BACL|nr:hypothetical protein [Ferroacidibacillus organovorans]KYP81117.1 hypothetical protein AYJ22_08520 [Ferroacidibacillus organovorans]OAG92218.1 hypothetical protein AYW79_13275 [Ferroacidibacillus organovorans]OPG16321.1 hypothetical protein B2M26_05395 [Ferroacidibacillus organovorans]
MANEEPQEKKKVEVDWSRRQFLIGTGALTVVGLGAMFLNEPVAAAVRSVFGQQPESGPITVLQGDYFYIPNYMTWRVGDQISMTIHNTSTTHFHEMQIGRGFNTMPTALQTIRTQFAEDFWKGVPVTITAAQGIDNFVTNEAKISSDVHPTPWLLTQPGNGGFSPTMKPGGQITLSFTVPNKPGIWHYACFVQGYMHWLAGMRGTINILPA